MICNVDRGAGDDGDGNGDACDDVWQTAHDTDQIRSDQTEDNI